MQPCGNPSSHLTYTSYSSVSSVPEKRIQNLAVELVNGRFKALRGNQTQATYLNELPP